MDLVIEIDWSGCSAVESVPDRLGGTLVFSRTRVPVYALFENMETGATIEEFLDWFYGVEEWQVKAVLAYIARSHSYKAAHASTV